MTQDDKKLLLKDLCARLPYGVNLHIEFYNLQDDGELASRDVKLTTGNICYCFDNSHWVNFKPYLRSMSSMTDEEKDYVIHLAELPCAAQTCEQKVDFFNSHYIDWRNLIPKGLALEAPDGMYKTDRYDNERTDTPRD